MGLEQPVRSRGREIERLLSDTRRPRQRARQRRRRRQPGLVAQARAVRAAGRSSADPTTLPVRRAARALDASASSTAPPRPRSCSKRPSGSACTPSRSPTTTASTASCASPRPPRRCERQDRVRRRALARAAEAAERRARPGGRAPARARPRRGGLSPARRRDHRTRSCAAPRRAGRSTTSTSSPSRPAGTGRC